MPRRSLVNRADLFTLGTQLMREHGLLDWRLKITDGHTSHGACYPAKKVIALSAVMAEHATDAAVRNVILHEIAHARAPKGAHHGPVWRAIARAIGCDAARTSSVVTPRKYVGECPACGRLYYKNARRRNAACTACNGGKWNASRVLVWKRVTHEEESN